jgi:hypothetical protein
LVRQAITILALLAALSFWLGISWLYTALGLLLAAVLLASALAKPARPPVSARALLAPRPAPQPRPIIVVQQPPQHGGMGVFDMLLGTIMAHSVMASGKVPSPFKGLSADLKAGYAQMDSRLEKIEKKLGD